MNNMDYNRIKKEINILLKKYNLSKSKTNKSELYKQIMDLDNKLNENK